MRDFTLNENDARLLLRWMESENLSTLTGLEIDDLLGIEQRLREFIVAGPRPRRKHAAERYDELAQSIRDVVRFRARKQDNLPKGPQGPQAMPYRREPKK